MFHLMHHRYIAIAYYRHLQHVRCANATCPYKYQLVKHTITAITMSINRFLVYTEFVKLVNLTKSTAALATLFPPPMY